MIHRLKKFLRMKNFQEFRTKLLIKNVLQLQSHNKQIICNEILCSIGSFLNSLKQTKDKFESHATGKTSFADTAQM